jgi:uncharacterized protein YndB with AHSA1/START domain
MATASIQPISHVAPDNDAVICEIFIAAPRERIFEALTDPAQAAQWWGEKGQYSMHNFTMDVRPGGKWFTTGHSALSGDIKVQGEFLEIDPPRRLAYTWISSWLPHTTKVLWELEPHNGGTALKLTHTGFASNAEATKAHSHGWGLALVWLQAYAERGETVATRTQ